MLRTCHPRDRKSLICYISCCDKLAIAEVCRSSLLLTSTACLVCPFCAVYSTLNRSSKWPSVVSSFARVGLARVVQSQDQSDDDEAIILPHFGCSLRLFKPESLSKMVSAPACLRRACFGLLHKFQAPCGEFLSLWLQAAF